MAIATIVRARAESAGGDGDFAGHSLRAGFATAAARAGRTEAAIMRHGRWKSVQVARRYIRQGSRWLDNPEVSTLHLEHGRPRKKGRGDCAPSRSKYSRRSSSVNEGSP